MGIMCIRDEVKDSFLNRSLLHYMAQIKAIYDQYPLKAFYHTFDRPSILENVSYETDYLGFHMKLELNCLLYCKYLMFFKRLASKLSLTKTVGNTGEKLAAKYLETKGYVLLDKNYTKPWGEIDLITKKGRMIQFVEVKTLSKAKEGNGEVDYYEPSDKLTLTKKERLYKTIRSYLADREWSDYDWQLGACLVYLNKDNLELLEIEFIEEI